MSGHAADASHGTGAGPVRKSPSHLAGVELIVVAGFCFGGWDASESVHEALLVVSTDVVGGDEFDVAEVAYRTAAER